MAETRKVTIELVQREEHTYTPTPTPSGADNVGNTSKKVSGEGKVLTKSVILNQGYHQAKSLIISGVDASINRYLSLNEDYMGETVYNNAKTTIGKITGLGGAIMSGYTVGSMTGTPVGMAIGVGVAVVGWGANEFLSYQQKMSGYYQSLNASNFQTAFMRKRAGLTDGSHGTEN